MQNRRGVACAEVAIDQVALDMKFVARSKTLGLYLSGASCDGRKYPFLLRIRVVGAYVIWLGTQN